MKQQTCQIEKQLIDRYCNGETNAKETIAALRLISLKPEWEQYVYDFSKSEEEKDAERSIIQLRVNYEEQIEEIYGQFIPIYSLAAVDGENLCALQCEKYILKRFGKKCDDEKLEQESRNNYWLRDSGTPLFNIGRMLEHNDLYVDRKVDVSLENLKQKKEEGNYVIAIVNNDILCNGTSEDNDVDDILPNHAVILLEINERQNQVVLFNPSTGNEKDVYPLDVFIEAWATSKNYTAFVRELQSKDEYNPQQLDVSKISLTPELLELVEFLSENAHNVWGERKVYDAAQKGKTVKYAEKSGEDDKTVYNDFFLPYYNLTDDKKNPDRDMVTNTIKCLLRLGYRLVNVNKLHRCPQCGSFIELHNNYCSNCGRELTNEDFKE